MAEVEGDAAPLTLPGEGAALVAFMSFAVVRGFGAQHPLIALADRLHDVHHLSLGPLTTFYDATIEDSEDAEKLELAWQPAGGVRASAERIAAVIASDALAAALVRRAEAESLECQLRALADGLANAGPEARVRLAYTL